MALLAHAQFSIRKLQDPLPSPKYSLQPSHNCIAKAINNTTRPETISCMAVIDLEGKREVLTKPNLAYNQVTQFKTLSNIENQSLSIAKVKASKPGTQIKIRLQYQYLKCQMATNGMVGIQNSIWTYQSGDNPFAFIRLPQTYNTQPIYGTFEATFITNQNEWDSPQMPNIEPGKEYDQYIRFDFCQIAEGGYFNVINLYIQEENYIQYRGRNLFPNSAKRIETNSVINDDYLTHPLQSGKKYIVTADTNTIQGKRSIYFRKGNHTHIQAIQLGTPFTAQDNWHSFTFTTENAGTKYAQNIHIENGETPTHWRSAPEDITITINGTHYTPGTQIPVPNSDNIQWLLYHDQNIVDRQTIAITQDGLTGPLPRIRGLWQANEQYIANNQYRDVVILNNNYYIAKKSHQATIFDIANWEEFNQFQNVATQLLLAETGRINILGAQQLFVGDVDKTKGWIMNQGAITHSQTGLSLTQNGKIHLPSGTVEVQGDLLAEIITAQGLNVNNKFTVDTIGNFTATNGKLTGEITATSGKIGCLQIQESTNGQQKLTAINAQKNATIDINPSEIIDKEDIGNSFKVNIPTTITLPYANAVELFNYQTTSNNYIITPTATTISGTIQLALVANPTYAVHAPGLSEAQRRQLMNDLEMQIYNTKPFSGIINIQINNQASQIEIPKKLGIIQSTNLQYDGITLSFQPIISIDWNMDGVTLLNLDRTIKKATAKYTSHNITFSPVTHNGHTATPTGEQTSNTRITLQKITPNNFIVTQTDSIVKLSANGIMIAREAGNYFYVSNSGTSGGNELGFRGVIKKESNIPFLIAGGDCDANGAMGVILGKSVTIQYLSTGKYRIQHFMPINKYMIQLNVIGGVGSVIGYEKYTNYTDVWITENGTLKNKGFSFMIYGAY